MKQNNLSIWFVVLILALNYQKTHSTCSIGVNKCQNCDPYNQACFTCAPGYVINPNAECLKCAVSKCNTCPVADLNTCTTCLPTYGLVAGVCKSCTVENCMTCNTNETVCTACINGINLANNQCIFASIQLPFYLLTVVLMLFVLFC